MPMRRAFHVAALLATLAATVPALAQGDAQAPAAEATAAAPPKAAGQGVAVIAGSGATRDDTFLLARAVYASTLRPRQLDELRARILAGDPPPASASREIREVAELRAGVVSEDAASRGLLANIAQKLHVGGLLVVTRRAVDVSTAGDAGAVDAGADAASEVPTLPPAGLVTARLFLPDTGEFDAARYEPDMTGEGAPSGGISWRGTVVSLAGRFPAPPAPTVQLQGPPQKMTPSEKESRPFYMTGWFWGAIGAAAVLGGVFFFVSQDTSNDPIHLQMRVPK